jgi:hypothetical protein
MADTGMSGACEVNLPKVTELAVFSRRHNEREHMTITEIADVTELGPCPSWCLKAEHNAHHDGDTSHGGRGRMPLDLPPRGQSVLFRAGHHVLRGDFLVGQG